MGKSIEVPFTFVDEDGDEYEAVADCEIEDAGIGAYEHFGTKGVDRQIEPFINSASYTDGAGVKQAITLDEIEESTQESILDQAREKADDDGDFDPGDDE